jgi:hypothetical protein
MHAKETYEAGDPVTAELGPKPRFLSQADGRPAKHHTFDMDDSKARSLIFSIGYRYPPYLRVPPTNRREPLVTFNFPVPKIGPLLTDRNR